MALSITNNIRAGVGATAEQLTEIFSSLETYFNTTKIEGDVIQFRGLTNSSFPNTSITRSKLEAVGQQITSNCSVSSVTTSFVDIPNMTVSITTTGRPVMIQLIDGGTAGSGLPIAFTSSITTVQGAGTYDTQFKLVRNTTDIFKTMVGTTHSPISVFRAKTPISSIRHLDTPPAGTYTYKMQILRSIAGTWNQFTNAKMVVYEL
jgi:hypothetical protein